MAEVVPLQGSQTPAERLSDGEPLGLPGNDDSFRNDTQCGIDEMLSHLSDRRDR